MNIFDMHMAFRMLLDKGSSLNYPDFQLEEVDAFLNKAQIRLFKSKATGKSLNPLRRDSVEETEKRLNDLKNVTMDARIVPYSHNVSINKTNGYFVRIPDNFFMMLDETCDLSYMDCNGLASTYHDVEIKKTTHDKFSRMSKDPFNKISFKRVQKLPFGFYEPYPIPIQDWVSNSYPLIIDLENNENGTVLSSIIPIATYVLQKLENPYTTWVDTSVIGVSDIGNPDKVLYEISVPTMPIAYRLKKSLNTFPITYSYSNMLKLGEFQIEVYEIISPVIPDVYKLRYLRLPRKLDVELYDSTNPDAKVIDTATTNYTTYNTNICELAESVHDELVDEAISIALETIESKRYQSNSNENNKVS